LHVLQICDNVRLMFAIHPVPEDLAAYVACFWTLAAPASDEAHPPIAPDGCCEWIIHLQDAPLVARDETWRRQPREFVFGQLDGPLVLQSDRAMRCIGVRFHPFALAPLLRVSGGALASEELEFSALRPCQGLCDRDTLREALRDVVAMLRKLVREARPIDALVVEACRHLASPDDARIAALARRLRVSPRTLERRFKAEVGLSPKRYGRIARMQRSLAALSSSGARAVDVAQALGYADQAHFTRELASLAGVRPGEVLTR